MHNAEATTELRASDGALEAHGARAPGGAGRAGGAPPAAAGAAARRALARAAGTAARAAASLGRGAGSLARGAPGWRHGLATADGLWSRVPAGEVLLIVALLLEPALLPADALGRVALAMLVFAVISDAAQRLARPAEGHPAGRLRARAGDGRWPMRAAAWWRAWTLRLAPLALALAGALFLLDAGFAVVALTFLAVQVCRGLGTGRSTASAAALLALAVVLRVDAGAVALGAALRPHLLVFACLFGLFLGLCQGRERLLSAPTGRWPAELARRYVDVGIAALLCGLIVGYVQVLGHDPAIRAAAGAWAYLSAPFVLGGLLRYWHLAVVEERPVARSSLWLTDPGLAAAVAGCVATLGLSLHL